MRFGSVRLEEVLLKQRRVTKGQRPRERARQIESIVMAEDIATSSGESAYTEEEVTEEEEGRTNEGGVVYTIH